MLGDARWAITMFAKHATTGILPGWQLLLGRATYARVSDYNGDDPKSATDQPRRELGPVRADNPSHEHHAAEAARHPLSAAASNGHQTRTAPTVPLPKAGASARPVALSVERDPSTGRVTVRGELDLLTVPILASELARLIDLDAGDTTLDFADLDFIDARGLGCLVGFAEQLATRGARLTVTGASAWLRQVFEIVQLGQLLQPP